MITHSNIEYRNHVKDIYTCIYMYNIQHCLVQNYVYPNSDIHRSPVETLVACAPWVQLLTVKFNEFLRSVQCLAMESK